MHENYNDDEWLCVHQKNNIESRRFELAWVNCIRPIV